MTARRAWARAAMLAALVVAVDQATKQIAARSLERGEAVNVFFGLDFTNVRNTGVAFGAFAGGGAVVALLTVIAVSVFLGYFALNTRRPWLWLPVGVIAGGALGNLVDRIREGAVVDWIDPSFWPAFNLADVFIVLGILGMLYVVEGPRE